MTPPDVGGEKLMPLNAVGDTKSKEKKTLVEYIRDIATPKIAWDTLATLFSKKNDACLYLLESEFMTISQRKYDDQSVLHKGKISI